jgi:hypothetical protein
VKDEAGYILKNGMEETEALCIKQRRLRSVWLSQAVQALGCYGLHLPMFGSEQIEELKISDESSHKHEVHRKPDFRMIRWSVFLYSQSWDFFPNHTMKAYFLVRLDVPLV